MMAKEDRPGSLHQKPRFDSKITSRFLLNRYCVMFLPAFGSYPLFCRMAGDGDVILLEESENGTQT